MGHHLHGILGPDDVVADFGSNWLVEPVALSQNISLVPLTIDLRESIDELVAKGSDVPHEEFERLSSSVAHLLARCSFRRWIAYFETEYFGGIGTQSAALWQNGEIVFGPRLSSNERDAEYRIEVVDDGWPINEMLRTVGVLTDGELDEFDSIGLRLYRSTDEFEAD